MDRSFQAFGRINRRRETASYLVAWRRSQVRPGLSDVTPRISRAIR